MVRFVYGRAGSGREDYLIHELKGLAQSGEKILVMVPDQITANKERKILDSLGNSLASNIEVLSFKRLPFYVFNKIGGGARNYITPEGRYILMSETLESVRDKLKIYKDSSIYPEFIENLLQIVGEFKSYNIDTHKWKEINENLEEGTLKNKIKDLMLIYETYEGLLNQGFADSQDDLYYIYNKLTENRIFEGYYIFFDMFETLTPQRMLVVERLIEQAKLTTFTLCSDDIDDLDELNTFYFSNQIAAIVRKSARKIGKPTENIFLQYKDGIFSSDIRTIEKNLFNYDTVTEKKQKAENTEIYCISNPYKEAEFVAAKILKMVRKKGMRFRDFGIVTRSLDVYNSILEIVFEKYNIPIYLDKKTDVLTKPLSMFVFAALNCVIFGFSYNNVFTYLKSGIGPLTRHETDILENYVYSWNIKGSKWLSDFTYHPDGFNKEFDDKAIKKLEYINSLRKRAVDPLIKLKNEINSDNAKDISRAIYNLLIELKVAEKMVKEAQMLRSAGKERLAQEYEQLWNIWMNALDQMVFVIKGPITPERYLSLLKLMLSKTEIGTIPTSIDEVTVSSADRVSECDFKHVFLIGFCDGDFPKSSFEEGLINDREKEVLEDCGIQLSPTSEKQLYRENYYIYKAFTSATEGLTITFPQSDIRGGTKKPSYIISTLLNCFENLKVNYYDEEINMGRITPLDLIEGKRAAFEFMLVAEDKSMPEIVSLKYYFENDPFYKKKMEDIKNGIESVKNLGKLKKDIANKLYGRENNSPTSIETFVKCQFNYFCKYGLKIKTRKKNEFDSLETGSFIHYVIENIVREYLNSSGPFDLEENIKSIIKKYINETIPDYDQRSARFKYLFERLYKIILGFVSNLIYELNNSDFKPLDFELEINENGDLKPLIIDKKNNLSITGKIDRVDGFEKDSKLYIRIIDYKTGRKVLAYDELYYGIGLQMFLYLFAIWKNGKEKYKKEIVPAGVIYSPVVLDKISVTNRYVNEEDIIKKLINQNKGSGLLIDDYDIIMAMDKTGEFEMLPVSVKDGYISDKCGNVASIERLGKLYSFTEKKLIEIIKEIKEGGVAINPYKDSNNGFDSCAYCDMYEACRKEYDPNNIRKMRKIDRETFWQMVEGGNNNEC